MLEINYLTIANIIGWISVFFHIFAFASKDTKKMLWYNLISTTLLGISMIPFGGFAGTIMVIFSIFSKIIGLSQKFKINDYVKAIFGLLLGIIYLIFFSKEGLVGMFPSLSLIFIVLADLQTNIIKMKLWYYGSAFCWLIYAISIMSIPAIAYDIIGIIVLTMTILKLQKEQKKI